MKKTVKATLFSLIGIILVCLACIICSMSVINDRLQKELKSSIQTSGYLRSRIRDLDNRIEDLKNELENIGEDIQCAQTEAVIEGSTTSPIPMRAYKVGEYEGKIAIFALDTKDTSPVRVLNISVMALSESERNELTAGIFASDYDELCKIIDRYE